MIRAWWFRSFGWLAVATSFFLFTYNSGYGYDAVEYLVLALALLDGRSLFDFSPSKSPGIYSVAAGWLKLFPNAGHLEISILITIVFVLLVGAVYRVVKSSLGRPAAYWTAGLLVPSGFFMEMNFFEPEPFVVLLSLPALPALRNGLRRRTVQPFILAGTFIGAAAFFKSVALFYALGAALFIAVWARRMNNDPWRIVFRYLLGLCAGIALALSAPLIYYAYQGQAGPFLYWTFVFPAFHYPSDTVYLSKLVLKLAWFWLALAFGGLLVFHPRVRAVLVMCTYPGAALSLGLAALLALTKNQASHYVFPAAAFLCIFLGTVFAAIQEEAAGHRRFLSAVAVLAAVLMVSIAAYRPRVLRRLCMFADYTREQRVAHHLQCLVPRNHTMLCLSHPLPYWLARRLPAIPTVATHVQFAYHLKHDPHLLLRALDNPQLAVVEFDPSWTTFRAPSLKNSPTAQAVLNTFHTRLKQLFRPVSIPDSPYLFWIRIQDSNT